MAGGRIQCVIPSGFVLTVRLRTLWNRISTKCKDVHMFYMCFCSGIVESRQLFRPSALPISYSFSSSQTPAVVAFWLRYLKVEDLDFGPKVDRCIPPQLTISTRHQEGFSVLPWLLLAPILFASTVAPMLMTALISGLGDCGSDSLTMCSRSQVYGRPSGLITFFSPQLGQSIL